MNRTLWRKIHGGSTHFPIALLLVAALLMLGVGYLGGEMLLVAQNESDPTPSVLGVATLANSKPPGGDTPRLVSASGQAARVDAGKQLFLKNCAHCHGADARGQEGPDLHKLDWTDEQIAKRIRSGKKGQMTAFAGKFSTDDINKVIAYLRTLK